MKKFTVHKLWKAGGNGNLGQFFPKSCRAVLYMLAISISAVDTGSDGDDLAKLVEYHEEAHYRQYLAGIPFIPKKFWEPGTKPKTEQMADEYAWRKFYKVHGRWANVKGWM